MGNDCGQIDNKAVGKRIRKIRERNGLTQEEMAEILSVNPNAVRAYERGQYGVSKEVITRIRNHFRVTVDYLLFGAGEDLDCLLLQVRNAREEDKMKLMMHLLFYFVREKEQCFLLDAQEGDIARLMKEMFDNV